MGGEGSASRAEMKNPVMNIVQLVDAYTPAGGKKRVKDIECEEMNDLVNPEPRTR